MKGLACEAWHQFGPDLDLHRRPREIFIERLATAAEMFCEKGFGDRAEGEAVGRPDKSVLRTPLTGASQERCQPSGLIVTLP